MRGFRVLQNQEEGTPLWQGWPMRKCTHIANPHLLQCTLPHTSTAQTQSPTSALGLPRGNRWSKDPTRRTFESTFEFKASAAEQIPGVSAAAGRADGWERGDGEGRAAGLVGVDSRGGSEEAVSGETGSSEKEGQEGQRGHSLVSYAALAAEGAGEVQGAAGAGGLAGTAGAAGAGGMVGSAAPALDGMAGAAGAAAAAQGWKLERAMLVTRMEALAAELQVCVVRRGKGDGAGICCGGVGEGAAELQVCVVVLWAAEVEKGRKPCGELSVKHREHDE